MVIAITDTALQFALARRETLFPDAPVVFSGSSAWTSGPVSSAPVRLASKSQSRTAKPSSLRWNCSRRSNACSSWPAEETPGCSSPFEPSSARSSRESAFRSSVKTPCLACSMPSGPSLREASFSTSGTSRANPGNVVYPDEVARLVAGAASVPVYGTSDFYVGSGVVGGVVRGTRKTGTRLGEMALQILGGTRAQDIPIEAPQLEPYLDWRQLQRWGISEARVPFGTVVRFREPSIWDRYKFHILGTATIILAQSILIGALLVQSRRRRNAEEQVRGSEAKLRSSYERIRDLGARLLNAQDTERSRVARELHDDISQQVALLCIDIELLNDVVQDGGERLVHDAYGSRHCVGQAASMVSLTSCIHRDCG